MKNNFIRNKFTKYVYKNFCSFNVFIRIFFNVSSKKKNSKNQFQKVYFGGAKVGDIGGPYVKIRRLNQFFPESKWNFSLIYSLSNSPYLSTISLKLLKNKKIPLIVNQNGVFYPSWYHGDWEKQNSYMKKLYHAADYVFWQSNFCKEAADIFLGKRLRSGEVLYNAVDIQKFRPSKKGNQKIFKLLITGNIVKQNNYRISSVLNGIKEIIKVNRYIHLYIAGKIEDINFLYTEIKILNLDEYVTFLGEYSQKNAPSLYQSADAYISMTYQDNCPNAVIEAMSCGLPILYSASGGIPELVGREAGVGLEVPKSWEKIHVPSDQQILNGFFQILKGKKHMSTVARDRAIEMFDIKKWIKRHSEVFKINIENV